MHRLASVARPRARNTRLIIHKVMSLKPLNFRVIFIRLVGSVAASGLWCVCIRALHGFASKKNGVRCEDLLAGNVKALEYRESVATRMLVDEVGGPYAADSFGRQTLKDVRSSMLSQIYQGARPLNLRKQVVRGQAYEFSLGLEHTFRSSDIPTVALQWPAVSVVQATFPFPLYSILQQLSWKAPPAGGEKCVHS